MYRLANDSSHRFYYSQLGSARVHAIAPGQRTVVAWDEPSGSPQLILRLHPRSEQRWPCKLNEIGDCVVMHYASGLRRVVARTEADGQWRHALIDCYGQHRRPVARSNCLSWPTPQAIGPV